MQLIHEDDGRVVIRFSQTEVATAGLPPRPARIEYDQLLRLDGYSAWLDKQSRFSDGIDRLIKMADEIVYH